MERIIHTHEKSPAGRHGRFGRLLCLNRPWSSDSECDAGSTSASTRSRSRSPDPLPRHPRPRSPIVILLMGMTGSGKSTFISKATRNHDVAVGHSLRSATHNLTEYRTRIGKSDYIFLDTPGLNDTERGEVDIVQSLCEDLAPTSFKITGILYLHRISDDRIHGSSRRSMLIFQKFCGMTAMPHVVLLTTHWDRLGMRQVGEQRELELRQTVWADMIANGATVKEFDGRTEDALAIARLFKHKSSIWLAVQEQMIARRLPFKETDVGQEVRAEVDRLFQKHQQRQRIRNSWGKAAKAAQQLQSLQDMAAEERLDDRVRKLESELFPASLEARVEAVEDALGVSQPPDAGRRTSHTNAAAIQKEHMHNMVIDG